MMEQTSMPYYVTSSGEFSSRTKAGAELCTPCKQVVGFVGCVQGKPCFAVHTSRISRRLAAAILGSQTFFTGTEEAAHPSNVGSL